MPKQTPEIYVTQNPDKPSRECKPAELIQELLLAGELEEFAGSFGISRGDCHEITLTLVCDLAVAGKADGFYWVQGTGHFDGNPDRPPFDHSWLECDGWAIDAASGKLLFMDQQLYRDTAQACNIKRRDSEQTRKWVLDMAESGSTNVD